MWNLMLSLFSDLKKLISWNEYKTKRVIFFVITFFPKHENTEVYNPKIIKRRSSFSMSSFLQSMTSTLSTKRLRIFYWTRFIKKDHVAHI